MNKKIKSALISVYHKEGLERVLRMLNSTNVHIYSTGGTEKYINDLGISCTPVESLTGYPSILGGRVKTLHPSIFGGILGRRDNELDVAEMTAFNIPPIDLVVVDLYPFEETVQSTTNEKHIIENIDIGGPSMIRAAAKNYNDLVVVASKDQYHLLENILENQGGETSLSERRMMAGKAFDVCTGYDIAISNYFGGTSYFNPFNCQQKNLRYGENPHQTAKFTGDISELFAQLNGKELSYNNIVDIDAASKLISEFTAREVNDKTDSVVFAIIKHTNVCGAACRINTRLAWEAALAGDPESAYGGVLITNGIISRELAELINEVFFEVLIASGFEDGALDILRMKKNRILLKSHATDHSNHYSRTVLNGTLVQQPDIGLCDVWKEVGGHESSATEKQDMVFANIVCKHLKSNAIAIVKNMQLIGKGCGQTSRIDALKNAVDKACHFRFDLHEAVLSSDAFFPFDDCVKIAHAAGIKAFIQPGGSIRDIDSIKYCQENDLVMVMTGMRHFKH